MPDVQPEYQYSEITRKIIAAAFEVHNVLGCGFQEAVYQRALEIEFKLMGIEAVIEKEVILFYKTFNVGIRRVDFLIEKKITVEIKAISILENRHIAQAINYLEAFNLDIGMLLNFGSQSLEYRRLYHPRLVKSFKSSKKL